MSWAHNTGFGNSKTENEVISPQGNVVVSAACSAGFLGIDWAATDTETKRKVELNSRFNVDFYLFLSVPVHLSVGAYGDHKGALDTLELEVQRVVSHSTHVM